MLKKKLQLTYKQWELLQILLETGYSLNEAASFLELEINFEEQGFYERLIKDCKGEFYDYLRFFYTIKPLQYAIDQSFKFLKFKQSLQMQLLRQSVYPIIIFIVSLLILLFFALSILPQMSTNFEVETLLFQIVKKTPFILIVVNSILLIVIVSLIIIYYFMNSLFNKIIYFLTTKISFFQQLHSYYFLSYYIQTYECGLSSKQCIEYLLNLKTYSLFKQMIIEFNQKLNQGIVFIQCIEKTPLLSKECKYSIKLGSYSDHQLKFLKQGQVLCEKDIFKKLKLITTIIQVVAYLFVVIVVITVYQMMLVPLEMIKEL